MPARGSGQRSSPRLDACDIPPERSGAGADLPAAAGHDAVPRGCRCTWIDSQSGHGPFHRAGGRGLENTRTNRDHRRGCDDKRTCGLRTAAPGEADACLVRPGDPVTRVPVRDPDRKNRRSRPEEGADPDGGGHDPHETDQNWFKHAIANFLTGRYLPLLESAADAAQDDRVRFVMPTVNVAPDGTVVLNVTTALAQKPQDALDSQFDIPASPVGREEPTHPRNGLIPAREVYRQLRPHMVAEAAAAAPVIDAILADWPFVPRFFPIQFTRTCEPIANCSVFFPRQTVNLRTPPAVVQQEQLPAHGIVYVRQEPPPIGQPLPDPPLVEMWAIRRDNEMADRQRRRAFWRQPATTAPLPISLTGLAVPHVSVRLPMKEAMFSDTTRPAPKGMACTYLSLRRTVRALIDNRIAGEQLRLRRQRHGNDNARPAADRIRRHASDGIGRRRQCA